MTDRVNLTRTALIKFRLIAANLCHHEEELRDENLLKWLKARDFNIKAAEEMLRKAMVWREENKIDEILAWEPPAQYLMEFPYDMDGEDAEGYPVFIIPLGRWDLRRAYERGWKNSVLKYINQLLERALEKARMKNVTDPGIKYINQAVFVWDMEGLSMGQMASTGMIDFCLDLCKRLECHYPEIIKISIPINAPLIFAWLFAIVKPTLTKRTLDKIHIFGTNSEKWKPFLLQHIPMEQIPEKYGGTRKIKTEFPDCTSGDFSVFGEDWEDPDAGMFVVTVEPRDQVKIALDIKNPNTTFSWKFYTDDFDIGFAIFYEDLELYIIPNKRVDSQLSDQFGTYTAVLPGRYLLIFDNSYSRLRTKTLYYRVEEVSPDGANQENTTLGVLIQN